MRVYWFTSVRQSVRPFVRPSVRPSFRNLVTLIVKDFSTTLQARKVIFGIKMDDGMLYRGIANQPSPAYSSLYLSNFLSFHALNDELFRQRFL